jgi:KaiC/GvpD/RAD55 family RecA-like ATPase
MAKSDLPQRNYLPKIFDLEALFKSSLPEPADELAVGFDHGSTILIAGAPGFGRTVVSLAIVRDLLAEWGQAILYYITTEMSRDGLLRRYRNYGWFEEEDGLFGSERCRIVRIAEDELPQPTRGAGVLISKAINEIRSHRQEFAVAAGTHLDMRRGSNRIKKGGEKDLPLAFVIVDSVTALLKDSRDPGDRRRNVRELIAGLESAIGTVDLALVVMTSEQPAAETPAEIHLADVVFEVGLMDTGSGSRLRTMGITKCHGRYLPMGHHTWATLSHDNPGGVIAQKDLLEKITQRAMLTGTGKTRWGTIVIFPRPFFPPIKDQQKWSDDGAGVGGLNDSTRISSGIPGLDAMIRGDSSYWSKPVNETLCRKPDKSLFPGSTTIIMGRSGTGKTLALLQFLCWNDDRLDDKLPGRKFDPGPQHSLYINFENRPSRVKKWFPLNRHEKDARFHDGKGACHAIYRRRANLDFNALIAEITYVIQDQMITRIAIDGLSDLLATTEPAIYARMTESLLIKIRTAIPLYPKTIFISLESDFSAIEPAALEAISFTADNVVAFRNVLINDEQRKSVRVVKARGNAPDPRAREMIVLADDEFPLRIVPGLENYTGLDSPEPKPVLVALQLVAENPAEREYNKQLLARLKEEFGYPVRLFGFSRGEIHSTLADMATGLHRIPFSNVTILSIDEWWIRDLGIARANALKSKSLRAEVTPPLLRLDGCLPRFPAHRAFAGDSLVAHSSGDETTASEKDEVVPTAEFWFFEAEKSTALVLRKPDPLQTSSATKRANELRVESRLIASPNYADFGLFCVNLEVARQLGLDHEIAGAPWDRKLDAIPRQWGRLLNVSVGGTQCEWFEDPRPTDGPTLVDFTKRALLNFDVGDAEGSPPIGFAFDMETPVTAACTFIEFCWAFGAREDFLIRGLDSADSPDRLAAKRALSFLQFLVVNDLMPACTKPDDTERSLFSRHWYSSVCYVERKRANPKSAPSASCKHGRPYAPMIWPVPFFPVGALPQRDCKQPKTGTYCPDAIRFAIYDLAMRLRRHVVRIRACIRYRTEFPNDSLRATSASDAILQLTKWAKQLKKIADEVADSRPAELYKDFQQAQKFVAKRIRNFLTITAGLRAIVLARDTARLFIVNKGFCPDAKSQLNHVEYPYPDRYADERDFLYLAAARWLDLRDVLAMCDWADLRLKILEAEMARKPLSAALVERPDNDKVPGISGQCSVTALAGYSCEGSWLIGVDDKTHSPNLAARFIEEIASAHAAHDRAEIGAGIPSRKDFFDHHGNGHVPHLNRPDLTWRSFLNQVAATGRRRERTVCSHVRKADLFEEIDRLMQHSLLIAAEMKLIYHSSKQAEKRSAVKRLTQISGQLISELFEFISRQMLEVPSEIPCLTCPEMELCRKAVGGAGPKAR